MYFWNLVLLHESYNKKKFIHIYQKYRNTAESIANEKDGAPVIHVVFFRFHLGTFIFA